MGDMSVSEEIRKCAVFAAAFLGLGFSMMFAQRAPATSNSARQAVPDSASEFPPRFDVASVRQNLTPEPRWRMSFTHDGVSAKDVTLFYAIEEAYGLYDEQLWSGIPPWIQEKRFDIEAKYDVEKYPHIGLEQRRAMLQQLLADRFKLAVHREQKEFPIYALELAKGGPKFGETKPEDVHISSTYGPMCQVLRSKMGSIEMKGCSMAQLARNLTGSTRDDLGRAIVDRTGLTGLYSFSLNWTPDTAPPSNTLNAGGGPSIFTAVQEQLGLLLRSEKGPLETIVIDHVEMPTEN
jgi:uncharacterized protein (TIGR03435 family)